MTWHILITFLLIIYSLHDINAVNATNYRLPNNTKPHLYSIKLDFDIFRDYFPITGHSLITFEVIKPTDCITLHKANNIVIDEEYTEVIKSEAIIKQSWSPDEFYKIKLGNNLTAGNYTLKLKWSVYNNNSEDSGVFRFLHEDNVRTIAGTRSLVPTYARKIFPCWDEPLYKAEFKISVKHLKNVTALSNMPKIANKFDNTDKVLTSFDKSPRLSPHSIGIVLTDFNVIKNRYNNLTFYTITQDIQIIEHLSNMISVILSSLEKYTKIPYPMPKLDIVISPYTLSNSVNNLGLIILNSEEIIFPVIKSTMALYQYKKSTIIMLAEALSLQWFGNLVTPSWWNDSWLSYGISNFVAAEIIDQILKNVTTKARDWLSIDAYKSYCVPMSLVPIRFPSNSDNPKNIKEQLDILNVARYVLIAQMLEHIVTKEVFQTGLQNYLHKNQFSAVTTEDLWTCFQDIESNEIDVKQIMNRWLDNPGYTVLEVFHDRKTSSTRMVQKNVLKHYVNDTRAIPINFATKTNPNFSNTIPVFWMDRNESSIYLSNAEDWIIFNVQQLDQYRVVYDEENWRRIIKYLNTDEFDKIHPINRAIIIRELKEKPINKKNLKLILDLLPYLRREKNLLPLQSAYDLIFRLTETLTWPLVDGFSDYITVILEPIITNLHEGYDHEANNYFYKKAESLKLLFMRIYCTLKKTNHCQTFAIKSVDYILANPSEEIYLHDYSYSWTLCLMLNDYDVDQWKYFFSDDYPLLRGNLFWKYNYLRCAKMSTVVEIFFPKLLEDNVGNSTHRFMSIFNFVMEYADHDIIQILLNYFKDNFNLLQDRFRNKSFNEVVYNMMTLFSVFIKSQKQWNILEEFIVLKSDELDNQYKGSIINAMTYLHFSTINERLEFRRIIERKLIDIYEIIRYNI